MATGRQSRLGSHAAHRLLEVRQRRRRLEAELLDEVGAHLLVRAQGLGRPAAPVEREEAPRPQALVQRVLGRRPVELVEERGVAAAPQLGVEPSFERREVQLLEAVPGRGDEREVAEVVERHPPPPVQRVAEGSGRRLVAGEAGVLASGGDEALDGGEVELLRLGDELVPTRPGHDRGPRLVHGRERATKAEHLVLEQVRRRARRVIPPDRVDELRFAPSPVRRQAEQRERRPVLRAAHRQRCTSVGERHHRAEEADARHGRSPDDATGPMVPTACTPGRLPPLRPPCDPADRGWRGRWERTRGTFGCWARSTPSAGAVASRRSAAPRNEPCSPSWPSGSMPRFRKRT